METAPAALRVVWLTPPGRGAVASLAVTGPDAAATLDRWFRSPRGRSAAGLAPGDVVFGHWGSPPAEEVVLARRGAEAFELHGHGGHAAVVRLLADLETAGARRVDWPEALGQAAPDGLTAAAELALRAARSPRAAAVLLDQCQGALRHAILAIHEAVERGDCGAALDQLRALERWNSLGRRLIEPWRIVLAGPPNVGKSSLVNALAGYPRVIVHAEPGTTRDVVWVELVVEGWPLAVADTAGLRTTDEPIEASGVARAREALDLADLVVWVSDVAGGPARAVGSLKATTPPLASAVSWANKIDLVTSAKVEKLRTLGYWPVSAVSGVGLDEALSHLVAQLIPEVPPVGTALLFRQADQLLAAQLRAAVAAGRLSEASELCGQLLS